jgi:hypothetical protein
MGQLNNKSIAVLAASGFEESELTSPVQRLREEGANVHIISVEPGKIQAMKGDKDWTIEIDVDKVVSDVDAADCCQVAYLIRIHYVRVKRQSDLSKLSLKQVNQSLQFVMLPRC